MELGCIPSFRYALPTKCANFAQKHTSCNIVEARVTAAKVFWLSATGAPATVFSFLP